MAAGNASLTFGSLPLLLGRSHVLGAGEPCIAAIPDGADMGNPETVVASVASMLMDGDKARINRYGNQEIRIPLEISGEDLNVVAAGEALVMAEVNRGRNIITWTPPGPIGPAEPNVHDVVYSRLEFHFDDLSENRAVRKFTLILECAPFARRAEPTVVVAEPIPDTPAVTTLIDNCSSLTGWSSTHPVLSVDGGTSIKWVPNDPIMEMWSWLINVWIKRTGLSVPLAAGEYITLDLAGSTDGTRILFNGVDALPVTATQLDLTTWRYYFLRPAAVVTEVMVRATLKNRPTGYVQIFDISKVTRLPFIGTSRQRSFIAHIGGTARTTADLVVETEGDVALGNEVLVYTAPAEVVADPSLRQRQIPGTGSPITPDATAVSGGSSQMLVAAEFWTPIVRPGMHLLLGRLKSSGAATTATVQWSAATSGTPYDTPVDGVGGTMDVSITSDWKIYELGVMMLPPVMTPSAEPSSVGLAVSSASGAVRLDELWLLDLDNGRLSWFSDLYASVDVLPSRVVMRSASLDSERPQWLAGHSGDPSTDTDVSRRMRAPGEHEFEPGPMNVFVVSTHTGSLRVRVEAYERFMHHVTRKSA